MCGEEENNIKRPLFWIAVCFALGEAYAVAVVLLVLVFIINAVTGLAAKKMSAKKG